MQQTLIQALMSTWTARDNCRKSGNAEWLAKHSATLRQLESLLPSGSGIDGGTTVVEYQPSRVRLACAFHHMTDHGYYDGWTNHQITVRPSWTGIDVHVSGRDRDSILDSLHDTYHATLTALVECADGQYHFVKNE